MDNFLKNNLFTDFWFKPLDYKGQFGKVVLSLSLSLTHTHTHSSKKEDEVMYYCKISINSKIYHQRDSSNKLVRIVILTL